MRKSFKITAIVLLAVVILMVVLPMAFSGKLGDIVKREANAMLNCRVDFTKLDISLFRHFPNLSLELDNFSVMGVGEFEGKTLAAGDRVEVAVNILSIFGDSFEISKVWLKSPEIHALVLADGRANWDVVKPSEQVEEIEEETEQSGESSFSLSITSVAIENATVEYVDSQSGMTLSTAPVNLALSGDLSAETTTLRLAADASEITFVSGGETYASSLSAALNGTVAADFNASRYTLKGLNLSVNNVVAALDGYVELDGEDIVTDITLDCSKNNFKSILSLVPALYTKDFKQLSASGAVSLTGAVKGRLSGENYPAFNLNLKVKDGEFKYADLPKSVSGINITASVLNPGGTLDATKVEVPQFTASFGGQSLAATLSAATPISDLSFAATLRGTIDLGAIKEVYPLEDMALAGIITADAQASGRMSHIEKGAYDRLTINGKAGVKGIEVKMDSLPTVEVNDAMATLSSSKMALESFDIKIGRSDISATGSLTNYWGYLLYDKTLSGTLTLNSSLLDLNELMASVSSDEISEQSAETADSHETTEVIKVPENLNLALNCNLNKVLFQKMEIADLKGAASVKGGTLALDNLKMRLFDGTATASASYSTAKSSGAAVTLDASFADATFKTTFEQLEMLQKMVPLFEKIEGKYNMSLACKMGLDNTMSPILKSVNGSGKITSGSFKLSNVKALELVAGVVGKGSNLSSIETTQATVISFTIENGNVITKPFDVNIGKTKLTLSGLTGLDSSIDYKVAVALPQATIHTKIGGTFTSPKVTLDTAQSVKSVLEKAGVSEQVTSKVDNAKQELIAQAEAQAAKLIEAAKAESDKLVEKAKNPIAKVAAQAAGKKLVEEAERQAAKIIERAKEQ